MGDTSVAIDWDYLPDEDQWDIMVKAETNHVFSEWRERDCIGVIVRGPLCLLAYVGVPKGHPFHGLDLWGVDYDNGAFDSIKVHGGFTYAGRLPHIKLDIADDEEWYFFGWDYGHGGSDYFLAMDDPKYKSSYKTLKAMGGKLKKTVVSDAYREVLSVMRQLNPKAKIPNGTYKWVKFRISNGKK